MLDNLKIELGKYYSFAELQRQWEENYSESEPLTIEYLQENLPPEISLYQVAGGYVSFHLKSLSDISKITEGTLTVPRCKIDFKNPAIFSIRVSACGLDQGSHSDGIVFFQDSDKNFFVELEDASHERRLVNIKDLFHGVDANTRNLGYVYHIPYRGVVIKKDTTSINRAAHNANCHPNFSQVDMAQNSVYALITSKDFYRPLNPDPQQGLRLTVFDKPALATEDLARRMFCNSNCSLVYSSPYLHSEKYHEKYKKLLATSFRFPDVNRILWYEKTQAAGYGTVALLGNSFDKNAINYDQYTENFAKNFEKLFGERLSLEALRKHRIYIEIFTSDQGGESRDGTMQSFTIDQPMNQERGCLIRPCWMGYEGERYTGGRYQNILFKDMLHATLLAALLFNANPAAAETPESLHAATYQEGRQALQEIAAEIENAGRQSQELQQFARYCDLLQIAVGGERFAQVFTPARHPEIEEILRLTERILQTPLNESVAQEIAQLNDERLLKYFRLDQKPVSNRNEHCRHPALMYNIPLRLEEIPKTIARLSAKIENLKLTLSDGSKIRLRECLLHLGELTKIKWAATMEIAYQEKRINGIEQSGFSYKPECKVHISPLLDKELVSHYSDIQFLHHIASFMVGLTGLSLEQLTQVSLFRTAQLLLPVVCAEESKQFAMIQKRRDRFYFAPAPEYDRSLQDSLVRFCKKAKIAASYIQEMLDRFPKQRERFTADTFLTSWSESWGEILTNLIGIVRDFRSVPKGEAKVWDNLLKFGKTNPEAPVADWSSYCKEKPSVAHAAATVSETCEIELQKAAEHLRKDIGDTHVTVAFKTRKMNKDVMDEVGKTRSKLAGLFATFLECSNKTLRTEDWSLLITGMSYYLATLGNPFHELIRTLLDSFRKQLAASEDAEDMNEFAQYFATLWTPGEAASKDPEEDEETAARIVRLYGRWLKKIVALLQEIRDSERISGETISGYAVNHYLTGRLPHSEKPEVSSFCFYVFSGQGIHILHKFMAKRIYYSILFKNIGADGQVGFPKGYRSQIHFLDIHQLMAIIFGNQTEPALERSLFEIVRANLAQKLITPLGLAIIGSYRCNADNKIHFAKSSEVELDPYDLIATSAMGPELENQVPYPFIQELIAHINDQNPIIGLQLSPGIEAPSEQLYFVPAVSAKPRYFQISKNGGNVNIWKRQQSRLYYGCGWQPQKYYFLGCFEFPELEKDIELFLLPLVNRSHRKRQDRVVIFFKSKRDKILYAQPNPNHKLPAKILKLWDKDHDSAHEEEAYPADLFQGQAFILQELWPKPQLIAALTGQHHFQRFLSLAEMNL
jgi:hypothetical protein